MAEYQFKDYAYYYDLFYKDKDYHGEAARVDKALRDTGVEIKSILSFGCGTGRYERELSKLGYIIHGIDLSSNMINIAEESNDEAITYEVADIRTYRSKDKYDAVISLFQVMSYQTTNEDMFNALVSARESLREGGIILFDVWYGPGVLTDFPLVRVKKFNIESEIVEKIAVPIMNEKQNTVDVCYEVIVENDGKIRRFNEVHKMRYWFRPELDYLLKEVGFELIDNYSPDFEKSGFDSWTSFFIAKAK